MIIENSGKMNDKDVFAGVFVHILTKEHKSRANYCNMIGIRLAINHINQACNCLISYFHQLRWTVF